MPSLPKARCLQPGCPEYVGSGYCPDHTRAAERARGTTKERGYAGGWPKLRALKLRRSPMCELQIKCGRGAGRSDPDRATEVDHKIPISKQPELRLVWSNLQSACKPCNVAKGDRFPA